MKTLYNQSSLSSPYIIAPKSSHRASVIWLHGLGADGYDFVPIVSELNVSESLGLKFIFPHAPIRPITLNNGLSMRAWYDIVTLDRDNFIHDVEGVLAASNYVHELIKIEQQQGIASERIILAGFSQGGAIALFAGLSFCDPLGGILALSTYVPAPEALAEKYTAHSSNIMMLHGSQDDIIPLAAAEASLALLQKLGQRPDFRTYPMAHGLCAEELEAIRDWLKKILSPL